MLIYLTPPPLLLSQTILSVSTLVAVLCPPLYLIVSKGTWRHSEVGRHLMAFMVGEALVLTLTWIAMVTVSFWELPDPAWFQWLRLGAFVVGVLGVLAWRLLLLIRAWSRPLT